MDALTHAIEAYVSTLNGPFTDPLALQAIEMVLDYLPGSTIATSGVMLKSASGYFTPV